MTAVLSLSKKYDPEQSVKSVLKKYGLVDELDIVAGWFEVGGGSSPSMLKKLFIKTYYVPDNEQSQVYWGDIDLSDPVSWGDSNISIPEDIFFIELSQAYKKDEKRNAKRSTWY